VCHDDRWSLYEVPYCLLTKCPVILSHIMWDDDDDAVAVAISAAACI
jgi:hypothetical protein